MNRREMAPRPDWRERVAALGYDWHTDGAGCGWNEGAVYVLTVAEAARLCRRAEEAYQLYEEAAARVLRNNWWSRLGLNGDDAALLRASWERREWSLAGRFDFLLDEAGEFKLIEFNADVALTSLETALVQRDWQQHVLPGHGQFNRLHEMLVAAWRRSGQRRVHCAWRPRHREVEGTVRYMARVIREAGLEVTLGALHCLGWDRAKSRFVGPDGETVACCYKFYPWDWMLREPFARHVANSGCHFVEPLWRLLFSSKGLLSILWEAFPGHPALLPCFDEPRGKRGGFVSKPVFGREGQNITIWEDDRILEQSSGEWEGDRLIFQQCVCGPRFSGFLAQFGVWMVGGEAVALGMRESSGWIINGDSPFVPHVVVESLAVELRD